MSPQPVDLIGKNTQEASKEVSKGEASVVKDVNGIKQVDNAASEPEEAVEGLFKNKQAFYKNQIGNCHK